MSPRPRPCGLNWKLPVFLILIQILAAAVQWGIFSARLDELFRNKDQQERHLEFIDDELKKRGEQAGEAKGFHDETMHRLDGIDHKLEVLEQRH